MRRIPELDAVRGIAIVLVLLHHIILPDYKTGYYISRFFWVGVDFFFILSGYLITRIIIEKHQNPGFLRNFYARRSLRIWPIYYLVIIVVFLHASLELTSPMSAYELLRYATYTQILPFQSPPPTIHPVLLTTWSLVVEEQFYLIWPPLFLLLGRGRFVYAIFGCLALSVGSRLMGFPINEINSRCDGLALGSLLAMVFTSGSPRRLGRWFIAVGLAAASFPVALRLALRASRPYFGEWINGDSRFAFDLLALNVVAACLIGLCIRFAGRPILSPLRNRFLCFLGLISYGLYLYHSIAYHYAEQWFTHGKGMTLPAAVVGLALSFAMAVVSWYLIEQPLLRLKDAFGYQRPARVERAAACSAALAASGAAKDDPSPDEAGRAKFREQALGWLRAHLSAREKALDGRDAKARQAIVKNLDHWKEDTDLAGIRDEAALAKLPEGEREAFRSLWADVEALRVKAGAGNEPRCAVGKALRRADRPH
jgi:peptidoglycan/LPS O-acetylase OafA/YrhL